MNGEYPNYPREMVEEFEAQIAALTKERDDLLKLTNVQEQLPVPRLREQLKDEHIQHKRWQMACAASQAREAKLREALEELAYGKFPKDGDEFTDDSMRLFAGAALAIPQDYAAPVIPAGWVMVPEELTQEMFESVPLLIQPQLAFIWKTLLAAAPKPEDV